MEVDRSPFDHAVINVHRNIDAAEDLFKSLGFHVTARGYHTLGSANHLMVFSNNYLELLGIDEGNPHPRADLLEWPMGLSVIVFRSSDADATHARLQKKNVPVLPARAFSRDVFLEGCNQEASFRTVSVQPHVFPAGRLYFCEHSTPGLVWHQSFQTHPNTATNIVRTIVSTKSPDDDAASLANVVDGQPTDRCAVASHGVRVEFRTADQLSQLYGAFHDVGRNQPYLAALTIRVRSLAKLNDLLDGRWNGKNALRDNRRILIAASSCFGATIEFVETAINEEY